MNGIVYKCSHCQKEQEMNFEQEDDFPKVYDSIVKKIKKGAYGEEWKGYWENTEKIATDISKQLYVCRKCHSWRIEPSLSLFIPLYKGNRQKTAHVTSQQLKQSYRCIHTYTHRCNKCGIRMRIVKKNMPILTCLECGHEMFVK